MKTLGLYVGDLCYVHNDESWSKICDMMSANNNLDYLKTDDFVLASTDVGDGSFPGYSLKMYGVDSGTLGMIWLDKITLPNGILHGNIFQ